MNVVHFRAADHVIALETDVEVLQRYFRWKTALLAADGLPADTKVRIVLKERPEEDGFVRVNDTDYLHTSLWKNTVTDEYCITVPERSLSSIIKESSMLANQFAGILAEHDALMLHSCGLAYRNKGILIAGFPGTGKSTLAVSWLQRGSGYLSDDTVWLHKGIMYPVESTIHPEKNKPGIPLGSGNPFEEDKCTDQKHHLDLRGLEKQFLQEAPVSMLVALKKPLGEPPRIEKCTPMKCISMMLTSTMSLMHCGRAWQEQFRREMLWLQKLPAYVFALGTDTDMNAEILEKLVRGENICTD